MGVDRSLLEVLWGAHHHCYIASSSGLHLVSSGAITKDHGCSRMKVDGVGYSEIVMKKNTPIIFTDFI